MSFHSNISKMLLLQINDEKRALDQFCGGLTDNVVQILLTADK